MKDLGKKKLLIIMGGTIGLVILIIIILLIYNAIFGKTSYKDIEDTVSKAAQKYYSDNSSLLPKSENEEITINDSALTAAGYLKNMNELTKKMKNVSCKATVIVSYAGGEYRYTPILDCGKDYATKTLSSYISSNVNKVYTGSGLYELNGELVYRGEDPANYVKFSGKTWRIVKVEDEKVVMILDEKSDKVVWDDRFNTEKNRNDGINDYSVSRIYDTLKSNYEGDTLFNKNSKKLLASHALYIGKRYDSDITNDGSIEKSNYLENQYIGLLPVYDFINASVDSNCNSVSTVSCSNYNYLTHFEYSWWTLTADASNTFKVYKVSSDGVVESNKAASNGYARPVIYLAKDALYSKGTGTSEDPFIIK